MTPRQDTEPDRAEVTAAVAAMTLDERLALARIDLQLHTADCMWIRNNGASPCTCGEAA